MPSIEYEKVLATNNAIRKQAIKELKQKDTSSLILFAMYVIGRLNDYKTLSDMMLTLGQRQFYELCQKFGGQTITVPTLDDIDKMINVLQLYNLVDVEGVDLPFATMKLQPSKEVLKDYTRLERTLRRYGAEIAQKQFDPKLKQNKKYHK